jgi:hypothetical protein
MIEHDERMFDGMGFKRRSATHGIGENNDGGLKPYRGLKPSATIVASLRDESGTETWGVLGAREKTTNLQMKLLKCLFWWACLVALPLTTLGDSGADESSMFVIDTRGINGDAGGSGTAESGLFVIDARGAGSSGGMSSALMTIDTRDGQQEISLSVTVMLIGSATPDGVTVSAWQNGMLQATAQTSFLGLARLDGLRAGYYEVRAERTGYAPAIRSNLRIPEDAGNGLTMILLPQPANISLIAAGSTPDVSQMLSKTGKDLKDHLRQWTNGAFDKSISLGKTNMTIVITHGWASSSGAWPSNMAKALSARLLATGKAANIVAWDWQVEAGFLPTARADVLGQGLELGRALREYLGGDYARPVHFIGHSLGTLVNATAANYVHNDDPNNPVTPAWVFQRTHMTLFDHAQLSQADMMLENIPFADPVPKNSAYVDTYLTAVGVYKDKALNVFLQKSQDHSYPYLWYMATVTNPGKSVLGFHYSFENLGDSASFPVPDDQGTIFGQDPLQQDDLALIKVGKPDGLIDNVALNVFQFTDKLAVMGYYLNVVAPDYLVDQVGNAAGAAARTTGQVTSSIVLYVVNHYDGTLDPMNDPVYGVGATTPAMLDIPGYAEEIAPKPAWSLQLNLQPTPPPFIGPLRTLSTSETPVTNTPAYVWLPIQVPSNTVAMTFDFKLSGDGAQDCVAAGINMSNLFSLPCQYIPRDQWQSSGTLMVEQWAGQDVELFFGVVGGTSTNAAVTIEGIRFLGVPRPIISTRLQDGQVLLQWPEAAPGYVLEVSTNLASLTGWSSLTNVTKIGGENYYTNATPADVGYYRLKR